MESPLEWFFFGTAILGASFFIIRLILQLSGFIHFDIHTDHDLLHTDHDTSDSYDSFKFFTIQNLTAFFMMFGLVGLGMVRSHIHIAITLICACFAGVFTVYLLIKILSSVAHLESSGSLDMMNAIGQEGVVYLSIPTDGSGQIQISIQGRMQIFDAICEHGERIETGERVIVLRVVDGYTLSVEKK
jgi:membrane protein implicated in regulation of membrane protease activity